MKIVSPNRRYSCTDVSPEDLAAQLTLIDMPIFKSVRMEELTCPGGRSATKSPRKQDSSPNLVAMNRQFNQVTFWVVGQILSYESARYRAELISHFIKTAKQLFHLNNLHSSYAVVSALLSSPIYRLEKTWYFIKKKHPKDKAQFDVLKNLYSDNNNYESLRAHLASCDLPCIPYLGMYSRDIIYINEVHQEGTVQRAKCTSKILKSIERFQTSSYDTLTEIPEVQHCLSSSRYIDELQKFVEDENYRRSLELEPQDSFLEANESGSFGNGSWSLKRSTLLLASLVQSAVFSNSSHKSSGSPSPRRSSSGSQRSLRYLIDDSFINHTILPPMSLSS